MNEITLEKLSYGGSNVAAAVDSEVPSDFDPRSLRLEVYVDDADVREMYLIRRRLDELGNGSWEWEIDRRWPYRNTIEFQLWVLPTDSPYPPEKSYEETQEKIWSDSVSSQSDGTLSAVADLELTYSVGDAPDAVTTQVTDANGNPVTQDLYPRDVRSALDDFARDTDDGVDYLEKSNVTALMEDLAGRVDGEGPDNAPDGNPDYPMDVADQDGTPFCGPTSLLLALGVQTPRRAIEYCRSIYQPEAYNSSGDRLSGFLSRSSVVTVRGFEQKYDEQRNGENRSPREATADVMMLLIRYALLGMPPISYLFGGSSPSADQYRDPGGGGLNQKEVALLMEEIVGVDDAGIVEGARGSDMLRTGGNWADSGLSVILFIDGTFVEENGPKTASALPSTIDEPVTIDHGVTLLSASETSSDTWEMTFQNPWGGQVDEQTVESQVVDRYLDKMVGGPMGDAP